MDCGNALNIEPGLLGRGDECAVLDEMLSSVRGGQSRTLVLTGEPGIGKTALLDYAANSAQGMRLLRATGVESDMELAFAFLHQLCAPLLDGPNRLPPPQRDALAIAFGETEGPPPDRFMVGLALLGLLTEATEHRPVLCLVDDAQWLDEVSAKTLGFVARRLLAEPIGFLFATREPSSELDDLPGLRVSGLAETHARALLHSAVTFGIDDRVRDRIVAETRGNPLALLELPRGLTITQLAGGFGLVDEESLPARLRESFQRRIVALPEHARLFLLIAAAEPVGDPLVIWRAADALDVDAGEVDARTDGLLTIDGSARFRHPLVRSAVYRSAPPDLRRRVHLALAEATDHHADPDRRAWHLAAAAAKPDEDVAAELERSAGRAQARGGFAASAAFLGRAVALTQDPERRAERALRAAEANLHAGAFDTALGLLATVDGAPLVESQRGRADMLRGHIGWASGLGSQAPPLLLSAGRRLEPFDAELARQTYMTAWFAAGQAGRPAENVMHDICEAIRALPHDDPPQPHHQLLEGIALLMLEGFDAATPILQRATEAIPSVRDEDLLRWGMAATVGSAIVWDIESLMATTSRLVRLVRETGALAELPLNLYSLGVATAWMGDLRGAAALAAESENVSAATGSHFPPFLQLRLLSLQGTEQHCALLIAQVIRQSEGGAQGDITTPAHWAGAVLYNGLARYDEALSAARKATANPLNPTLPTWALPELVEAAVRSGNQCEAQEALDRLIETTQPSGLDSALGIEARSRAMLSDHTEAEDAYREAIERLGRTRLRPEAGRAHLLYGEWLRREGRRLEARAELRSAHEMFSEIGMEAFTERARRELMATGEKVRKRNPENRGELTPQEQQIARLARDGLSNAEIGAHLFISVRTVEWHMRKVFQKLGITSRRELRGTLQDTLLVLMLVAQVAVSLFATTIPAIEF
jgi:DNA-binding CsgD family transcriptional regulator